MQTIKPLNVKHTHKIYGHRCRPVAPMWHVIGYKFDIYCTPEYNWDEQKSRLLKYSRNWVRLEYQNIGDTTLLTSYTTFNGISIYEVASCRQSNSLLLCSLICSVYVDIITRVCVIYNFCLNHLTK